MNLREKLEETARREREEAAERRRREQTAPSFSRCSAGSRGWFWVVQPPGSPWGLDVEPMAEGFEPTAKEAEAKARSIAGEWARQLYANFAAHVLLKRACEKRMARDPNGDDASRIEFVWEAYHHVSDEPCVPDEWKVHPHRVVKKTARRVYVEREPYREPAVPADRERHWYDYLDQTFVLDRRELERGQGVGPARRRWYGGDFYQSREEAERAIAALSRSFGPLARPDWADVLDLEWPITRQDVKEAYRRKAKELHPDHGGDHDEFVKLEAAYRMALSTVKDLPPR
jgi:hypothetical protein